MVDAELDELLPHLPAVSLDGAKGVGKTSTARNRGRTLFALDRAEVREIVGADPDRLASGAEPIVVDEWQRFPPSWDLVRRAVDAAPRPGRFLLTGSASPAAPQTHSGAARIVRIRMRPMTLFERGVEAPSVSLAELLAGSRPAVAGTNDYGWLIHCQHGCRHAIICTGSPSRRSTIWQTRRWPRP